MQRIVSVVVVMLISAACVFVAACSQQGTSSSSEGPNYIDDKAMGIIAKGFEQRSAFLEKNTDYSADTLKKAIQIEIDNDADLKNAQFKDTKMQETVISYLNSLDAQMDVLNGTMYGSTEYYIQWEKAVNQRSKILKTLVNDYGLTVQEKYQKYLDELVANGNAVSKKETTDQVLNDLLNSANWDKSEDFGYYTYTAIVENTSSYDFRNLSVILSLYDADGVKTEAYTGANSWRKGEKVKFEAYGEKVDAQRVEAIAQYYEVV